MERTGKSQMGSKGFWLGETPSREKQKELSTSYFNKPPLEPPEEAKKRKTAEQARRLEQRSRGFYIINGEIKFTRNS